MNCFKKTEPKLRNLWPSKFPQAYPLQGNNVWVIAWVRSLRKKSYFHACIITESVLVNLGTSLQLLLTQEIVRRQGEDTQEDSLTDTQVRASLQPLLTQEVVEKQEEDSQEDSLTDT